MHIWLRDETKPGEQRTPLTPMGAAKLMAEGYQVTVEESETRIFPDQSYKEMGCSMAPSLSWKDAPNDAIILGLKELPEDTAPLTHKHIYFAHAYKDQDGWQELLSRFKDGDGKLYDLEFLTEANGRRVAAFGYWAGFAGMGVALENWIHQNNNEPLGALSSYPNQEDWLASLGERLKTKPSVFIMGALGRCGQGARDLATHFDLNITAWDRDETAKGGPFPEILQSDIFINCVLLFEKTPPFLTKELLQNPERKLSNICDVSCDPTGPVNPLPIYDHITTMTKPTIALSQEPKLDLIAIDHLPSLLPKESSEDYENQLLPHLLTLKDGSDVWQRALEVFERKSHLALTD